MVKYCVAVFSCCVLLCVGLSSECDENEELQCVHSCPHEVTCMTRDVDVGCPAVYSPCSLSCVCKPGYIRNDDDHKCVPEKQCEICQRENEYYDCSTPCDNVCATLNERNRTNCDVWHYKCNRKCYCKDGYARDSDRNCVPVDECPEMSKDENN
uniref:TIL domain-containing protein n=1 Tax=Heliothis virescens TaxID=7102 RepID=A0A2A4J0T0_HELVI